ATVALAAAYSNLIAVVAGTTAGMVLANAPVVFLGKAFSDRLPLKAIHYVASGLFLVLGVVFLVRAVHRTISACRAWNLLAFMRFPHACILHQRRVWFLLVSRKRP